MLDPKKSAHFLPHLYLYLIFSLFFLVLTACPHRVDPYKNNKIKNHSPLKFTTSKFNKQNLDSSFRLDVGDVIGIKVYGEPKLKGTFQIYPSCKIQFPLIKDVKICSRTPGEIRAEIAGRLHREFFQTRPSVSVKILIFNSKKIHVLGQVQKPGRFNFMPGLTLVQAIAMAGGFTSRAAANDTRLIRKQGAAKRIYRIALGSIGSRKATDTKLRPGDVVFVPKSWL